MIDARWRNLFAACAPAYITAIITSFNAARMSEITRFAPRDVA
jgi:hypothetical protein